MKHTHDQHFQVTQAGKCWWSKWEEREDVLERTDAMTSTWQIKYRHWRTARSTKPFLVHQEIKLQDQQWNKRSGSVTSKS